MPRKGQKRKKKRTHVEEQPTDDPRSFVFVQGKSPRELKELCTDLRAVMQPNTATNLKERKSNKVKDFVAVASHLGVTHLMALSTTETHTHLRLSRLPRGPTVTFRINEYSSARDIQASMLKTTSSKNLFTTSPLVILNKFGEDKHMKLTSVMLQNMFPSINVQKVSLADCRRTLILDHDPETNLIHLRHYAIKCSSAAISERVRNITDPSQLKNLPRLGGLVDVSEYILQNQRGLRSAVADKDDDEYDDELSETRSEASDMTELSESTIASSSTTSTTRASSQVKVRMVELGPRLSMSVLKVENGNFEGEVIYHALVNKTKEEADELKARAQNAEELKKRRRAEQEANVKRKEEAAKAKMETEAAAKAAKEARSRPIPTRETARAFKDGQGKEEDGDAGVGEGARKRAKYNPLYSKKSGGGGSSDGVFKQPTGRGRGRGRGSDRGRGGRGRGSGGKGRDGFSRKKQ